MRENEGSIERGAGIVRNGGVIAGLIGLVLVPQLILPGVILGVGGEALRKARENKRKKGQ